MPTNRSHRRRCDQTNASHALCHRSACQTRSRHEARCYPSTHSRSTLRSRLQTRIRSGPPRSSSYCSRRTGSTGTGDCADSSQGERGVLGGARRWETLSVPCTFLPIWAVWTSYLSYIKCYCVIPVTVTSLSHVSHQDRHSLTHRARAAARGIDTTTAHHTQYIVRYHELTLL